MVMAGCDGRAKSRSYYTDFAKALPEDTVILTAGCAKYRYNKLNLGEIGEFPGYWMPDSAMTATLCSDRPEAERSLRTGRYQ